MTFDEASKVERRLIELGVESQTRAVGWEQGKGAVYGVRVLEQFLRDVPASFGKRKRAPA